ncbi:hypothetical protein BaRGS_00002034, partial [Batillaria attramentaria]
VGSGDNVALDYTEEGKELFQLAAPVSGCHASFGTFPHWCLSDISACKTHGFTVGFWFKHRPVDVTTDDVIILTNGGTSSTTDGFYVTRRYGDQFEIGVATGGQLWQNKLLMRTDDTWTHVAIGWSESSGLNVTVDGMYEVSAGEPSPRAHVTTPEARPVEVGLDIFGEALTSPCAFVVQRVDVIASVDDVTIFSRQSAVLTPSGRLARDSGQGALRLSWYNDRFLQGCSSEFSIPQNDVIDIPSDQDSRTACRRYCSDLGHSLALMKHTTFCSCSDAITDDVTLSSTCNDGEWHVYSVHHVIDKHQLKLRAWSEMTTGRNYTKPGEDVRLYATLDLDLEATFTFSFQDGTTLVTSTPPVYHAFKKAGTHNVTVSAKVGIVQVDQVISVTIEDVDEGKKPDLVVVTSWHEPDAKTALHSVLVVDEHDTNCSFHYGDGARLSLPTFADFGTSRLTNYTYYLCGRYRAVAECNNTYGQTSEQFEFLARAMETFSSYRLQGVGFNISVAGGEEFLQSLIVEVNGSGVDHQSGHDLVTLSAAAFTPAMDNLIEVKYEDALLTRHVVRSQRPLDQLTVEVDMSSRAWSLTANVTVTIPPCDFTTLTLDFGQGDPPSLFFVQEATSPVVYWQEVTYSQLGAFLLNATIANDLTVAMDSTWVSVEVPIASLAAMTANVTSLTEPVHLKLDVNSGEAGPDRVFFTIDYADGSEPREVFHVNDGDVFQPLTLDYTYSNWGIYTITVTASNNISSVSHSVVVQVGQNITFVDLTTSTERVTLTENVTFLVTCPTGSDVTYTLHFGDGTEFSMDEANGITTTSHTVGEATSAGTAVITHRYKEPGYYSVDLTATNAFTTMATTLCPTVVVIDTEVTSQTCAPPTVTLAEPYHNTSVELPAVNKRSAVTKVRVEATINCPLNVSELNYSWKAALVTVGESGEMVESTVHKVCRFQDTRKTLVLPPRTLPYGLYRLSVTVSPVDFDLVSTTVDLYLEVAQSEPVSKIEGGEVNTVMVYATTILDVSHSRDPDLETDVRRDLSFHMFCMPESFMKEAQAMEFDEILQASNVVGNKTMFRTATRNEFWLYEYQPCFNDSDYLMADLTVYNGKVSFPADHYLAEHFSFAMLLWTERAGLAGLTSQIVEVRKSNTSLDDLSSLLDLAANADPDTAIRLIGGAADAILSADSSSAEEQEKLSASTEAVVNTLGSVAKRVDNANQATKCAGTMKTMTSNKDLVNQGSRSLAADAFMDLANGTQSMEDATVDDVSNFAGETLGGLTNIFPATVEEKKSSPRQLAAATAETPESTTVAEIMAARNITMNDYTTTPAFSADWMLAPKTDSRKPFEIAAEKLNSLPEDPTYDELFTYVFDDCLLFRKVMKDADVQDNCPCMTSSDVNLMKCDGDTSLQDRVFNTMTFLEHPDDIYEDAKVAGQGNSALGTVADTVNDKTGDDDNTERAFNTERFGMKLQKVGVANNTNSTGGSGKQAMGTSVGAFSMPTSVLAGASDCPNMNTMLLGDTDNPYTFSEEKSSVGKGVMSLGYSCGGEKVSVADSAEPIEMWMERDPKTYKPGLFVLLTDVSSSRAQFNYHPVNLTDKNSSLQVVVRPGDANEAFDVYVQYEIRPNLTHHDFIDSVPKTDLSHLEHHASLETLAPEVQTEMLYTVSVPTSLTAENGTYWVGIKLKKGTVSIDDSMSNTSYTLLNLVSGCRFWDETNNTWSSEGCEVGELTSRWKTQCLCTHLTSFGSDAVVPPNTIDFSNVWAKFGNLDENAAVFSTVISLLGVYIIMMVWARFMDKRDLVKWGAMPLEDNLPSDNYHYQLAVYTGIRKNAGTDSHVRFILSGEDCDTGVRHLADGKRKHFGRGSIYNFVLSTERSLGPLTFLRVWHDNGGNGKNKSWYLDQFQITDLQTGEKSYFLCDKWLAVEEDDGMVDRILPVAGINDLIAFKHLFSSSARKKLANDHLWFSVFSRPTRSNFTRVQRISCCMSLLFLTMITNAMWFKGESEQGEQKVTTGIKLGPIQFTLGQVFISFASTMIVFPVNFLLVLLFRRCRQKKNAVLQTNQQLPKRNQKYRWKNVSNTSAIWGNKAKKTRLQKFKESMGDILSFHQKNKYEEEPEELVERKPARKGRGKNDKDEKKRKKKPLSLPHWCIYIAWVLCFLSVVTSAFFTILYSMQWGAEKANEWLITFVMSFFQNVIIIQPVKVLLLVAFISCILKKPDLDEEDLDEDLNKVLSPNASKTTGSNEPVSLNDVQLERQMGNTQYAPPDPVELDAARQLRLNEIKMEAVLREIIQTVGQYWKWLENSFIPNLFDTTYANGTEITYWQDRACISDHETRRVGVARIRQLRVKNDTCTVQDEMKNVYKHCRDAYSWLDDDAKDYFPGWVVPTEEEREALADEKTPWVYQNSAKLKNAPYVGTLTTYKGGGYVMLTRRELCRTKKMIAEAKKLDWLDLNTRAIFLEFTVYNPNVNLFGSFVLLTEFVNTGGATARVDLKIFRLLSYIGGWGLVVLLFEVVYACFTLYFFIRCIKMVRKERLKYFKTFWNILEFILLCFAVACIVFYSFKHILTEVAMRALKDRESDGFVNFQSIALYDETYGYIMSVVVFMATIQFLKLLQFNRKMSMLGDTVKLATKDLKVFSIAFLLYFTAFVITAYQLFGHMLSSYNNIIGAMESMFAFALGSFDFEAMQMVQPTLGPLFFFSYIMVVYIGLMSIFLTIIGDSFTQVKENTALQSNEYEIVDFMWKRFKGLLGFK